MFKKRRLDLLFAAVVLQAFLTPPVHAQVDKQKAIEDWKAMDKLCHEYQAKFLSESEAKKKWAEFKVEWEAWKKEFQPAWAEFQKRYGKDNIAVYDTFKEIEKPQGVSMDAAQVANVAMGVDITRIEKGFAEWAERWAADALRVSKNFETEKLADTERKLTRAEDAIRYLKIAKTWNPKGDYGAQTKEAEAIIKEVTPLWKKALVEVKWLGHAADFAGPDKPDELSAAALDFLRKNPSWTRPEYDDEHIPLAACVTGKGWGVWKKAPLTEQPTQYSIEMLVAFTGKADPELVYCYHMVFYTREEAGIKPGLPLAFANSKQYACFRMLRSKMPGK